MSTAPGTFSTSAFTMSAACASARDVLPAKLQLDRLEAGVEVAREHRDRRARHPRRLVAQLLGELLDRHVRSPFGTVRT